MANHAMYLSAVLLASTPVIGDDEIPRESIRWLNWPVTAQPFNSIDSGALIPSPRERYLLEEVRDVRIGLRSDGVVVWEYIKSKDDSFKSEDEATTESGGH